MFRLLLTVPPRSRAGLGADMGAYEIAFLLCVLCVACGVAAVVGSLIERFIVTPIVRRR